MNNLYNWIDAHKSVYEHMSDTIWDYAEIAFHEHRSAQLQADHLKENGFRVATGIASIDTAFVAEYGSGKPVIAILGEYDALPELGQYADCPRKDASPDMKTGHGCGHHLLGTAGVEAVCALKAEMDNGAFSGTIRYYGCPAEEGGCGKVFMIRAGCFADVDIAISWHPSSETKLMGRTNACKSAKFRFKGTPAHAAASPHLGRSALDAAELMNTGVQYLREHVPDGSRIHYAFLDAGGPKPNVVQQSAELIYIVRSADNDLTADLFRRLCLIANGAAMMTETTVEEPVVKVGYANIIFNKTLGQVVLDAMADVCNEPWTEEEMAYAHTFNAATGGSAAGYNAGYVNSMTDTNFPGSTDYADVSWNVPSIAFSTTSYSADTALHSWSSTAQGKSSGAKKGMHNAAKIMAACAQKVFTSPELLAAAKAEFDKSMQGRKYTSLLPADSTPNNK